MAGETGSASPLIGDVLNSCTSNAETDRYPTAAERRIDVVFTQSVIEHFTDGERFFAAEWSAVIGCWKVLQPMRKMFVIHESRAISANVVRLHYANGEQKEAATTRKAGT